MREIVDLIVRRMREAARVEAERRAQAAAAARAYAPRAAGAPAPGAQQPSAPAPQPVASAARTPASQAFGSLAGPAPGALGALGDGLPFPGLAAAAPARPALLGAFAGPRAFLAGFVLAEALAPPIALRKPRDA